MPTSCWEAQRGPCGWDACILSLLWTSCFLLPSFSDVRRLQVLDVQTLHGAPPPLCPSSGPIYSLTTVSTHKLCVSLSNAQSTMPWCRS